MDEGQNGFHPDHDFVSGSWEYMKNQVEHQIHRKELELKEVKQKLASEVEKIPFARRDVRDLEARLSLLQDREKMLRKATEDAQENLNKLNERARDLNQHHQTLDALFEQGRIALTGMQVEVSKMMTARTDLTQQKQQLQAVVAELHTSIDNLDSSRQRIEREQDELEKKLTKTHEEYVEMRGEVRRLEIKCEETTAEDEKWNENQSELLTTVFVVQQSQSKLQKKLDDLRMIINEILDNKYHGQLVQENVEKLSHKRTGLDHCLDRFDRDTQKLKRHLLKKTSPRDK